jgi:two-component system cell cycle sensor histidine kinase/response regulator CckA
MTRQSGGVPDEYVRTAARRLALVLAAAVAPALVGDLLIGAGPAQPFDFGMIIVVAAMLIGTLWMIQAGGPWRWFLGPLIVCLDVGAVAAGAFLPVGLDVAVALPLICSLLVVVVLDGWALRAALAAAWAAGLAGSMLARMSPGLSAVPNVAPAPYAAILLAFGTGLAYIALLWASTYWHRLVAESRAVAQQARVAEAAQHRSAERFRTLVESSPLATLAFDTEGIVNAWNPAAERLTGRVEDEVLGKSVWDLVPDELRAATEARMHRTIQSGETAGVRQSRLRKADGGEVRVEVHDSVARDIDGRPEGVVVQFIDVSAREALFERLFQGQRLEAVGQLAGGVAHDFNNSLTAIEGFASLIASGESPDPGDDARTILNAARHAEVLTRQLLAFSQRSPLQPRTVDLRDFIKTVEPLVRSLVGETITIRREAESRPTRVEVDPSALEQAILNLAANARDAMPGGGELTLAVQSFPGCVGGEIGEPEEHVGVVVSDTGGGIAPEIMGRIFDPFFTTKPFGKGTGLGLPMVHGFVAQSGGHVVVTSPPGRGAAVELHFPRSHTLPSEPEAYTRPPGGHETILFVEDDPGVAAFGLACLRRLGYDVTPAMNGAEAVALASARSEPFDLLFTDVVIPGMSGSELASIIRRHHPGTAILYGSGYSAEHMDSIVDGPEAPLLEKPYSLDQLAAGVRAAIAKRPTGPQSQGG